MPANALSQDSRRGFLVLMVVIVTGVHKPLELIVAIDTAVGPSSPLLWTAVSHLRYGPNP